MSPYQHSLGAICISIISWGLNSSTKDMSLVTSAALGFVVCITEVWSLKFKLPQGSNFPWLIPGLSSLPVGQAEMLLLTAPLPPSSSAIFIAPSFRILFISLFLLDNCASSIEMWVHEAVAHACLTFEFHTRTIVPRSRHCLVAPVFLPVPPSLHFSHLPNGNIHSNFPHSAVGRRTGWHWMMLSCHLKTHSMSVFS